MQFAAINPVLRVRWGLDWILPVALSDFNFISLDNFIM